MPVQAVSKQPEQIAWEILSENYPSLHRSVVQDLVGQATAQPNPIRGQLV